MSKFSTAIPRYSTTGNNSRTKPEYIYTPITDDAHGIKDEMKYEINSNSEDGTMRPMFLSGYDDTNENAIIKQGWLLKRSLFWKQYRKRWVVFKSGKLYTYKTMNGGHLNDNNSNKPTPTDTYDFGRQRAELTAAPVELKDKHPRFSLSRSGDGTEKVVFKTDSINDRDDWIKILNRAAKIPYEYLKKFQVATTTIDCDGICASKLNKPLYMCNKDGCQYAGKKYCEFCMKMTHDQSEVDHSGKILSNHIRQFTESNVDPLPFVHDGVLKVKEYMQMAIFQSKSVIPRVLALLGVWGIEDPVQRFVVGSAITFAGVSTIYWCVPLVIVGIEGIVHTIRYWRGDISKNQWLRVMGRGALISAVVGGSSYAYALIAGGAIATAIGGPGGIVVGVLVGFFATVFAGVGIGIAIDKWFPDKEQQSKKELLKEALFCFGFIYTGKSNLNKTLKNDPRFSLENLKKVYRKRAKEVHPDIPGGTKEQFIALSCYYGILIAKYNEIHNNSSNNNNNDDQNQSSNNTKAIDLNA